MFKSNKAQALAKRFGIDTKGQKVTKMAIAQFLATKTKYKVSTILWLDYDVVEALLETVYPDL